MRYILSVVLALLETDSVVIADGSLVNTQIHRIKLPSESGRRACEL